MAFGNVYIFNLYVESMTQFNLNGMGSAGSIAAPVNTTKPPYVPAQLMVGRTNLTVDQLNSPLFVNGANNILVNYGGENWKGTVTIPGPPSPSMQADLWLYIAYKTAFLFTTDGKMIPQQGPGGGAPLTSTGGNDSASGVIELTSAEEGEQQEGGGAYGSSEGEGGAPAEQQTEEK
jgi:hypothetical protein